jgi:general secretion pathway protein K
VAGGTSPDEGAVLAQATVDMRDKLRRAPISQRFEAEEDLLGVPGVAYDLSARLAPLVTTEARGGGRVNPNAAPAGVLLVLAGGDSSVVGTILAKRRSGDIGIDMSGLDAQFTDGGSSTRVKVAVDVPIDSGKFVRLARNVDLMSQAPDGTPWTTFRLSSSVQAARSDN